MNKELKVLLLNLASPPGRRLWRDDAGGFGVAIQFPQKYKKGSETTLHPFLPYASSLLLDAGYEFKVIDCQRLKPSDNVQTLSMVKKEDPDVIFSIISLPSIWNDLKILGEIKRSLHNVTIVGVGTVCRVIPQEILLKGSVDIVLRNDFPYISNMIDLIKALQHSQNLKNVNGISYVENEQMISTPESPELDINDLPATCYDSIPLDGYETFTDISGESFTYVSVLDSKGCPYKCIYCPYPLGYGKEWTFRSPTAIINEIEYIHNVRGVKGFAFRGQSFAYNRKQAIKICEEIIRRKLDVAWICESRVNEVSRELMKKMKEAGCRRIHYGVETGDPETLKIAKPGVELETTKKAFKITRENCILTQAHVILGWPNDDHRTLEDTRKFILNLKPDIINLNFLTPYPGTKMYEIAERNSLILTRDWSNYTSHTVVMRTKTLNANELYTIKKKIIRDFSKQKLRKLLQPDFPIVKRPRLFINKARSLVNKIMFPQD